MDATGAGGNMPFYRDTYIEIDLDAVFQNVVNLKRHFYDGLDVLGVVKADSYGHGAVMVARTLLEAGVRHFAVATIDEALELRDNGIVAPILVFGSVDIRYLPLAAEHDLTITAYSHAWLKNALAVSVAKPLSVQIKVDTGMNRLGIVDETQFRDAVALVRGSGRFRLTGVYTHLATAEEEDETYYRMQIARFEHLLAGIDTTGLMIHAANSAGSLKRPPQCVNMVRIGLLLNGISPSPSIRLPFHLQPSLGLYSKIVQVKTVPAHAKISYNGTYETPAEAVIGTIPIGYADGYDRRLKNGRVYLNGGFAPVVGRICMDYAMVLLDATVEPGTRVELLGPHIPLEEYCGWIGTNNYHATCAFTDRLPRVYKRHGEVVAVVNRRLANRI
jgi:alanine racemase